MLAVAREFERRIETLRFQQGLSGLGVAPQPGENFAKFIVCPCAVRLFTDDFIEHGLGPAQLPCIDGGFDVLG